MKNFILCLLLSGVNLFGDEAKCLPASFGKLSEPSRTEESILIEMKRNLGTFQKIPDKIVERTDYNFQNQYNPQSMLGHMKRTPLEIGNHGRQLMSKSTEQAVRDLALDAVGYKEWRGDIRKFLGDMIYGDEERNSLYSRFNVDEGLPGKERFNQLQYDRKINYGLRPFRMNPYAYVTINESSIGSLQLRGSRKNGEIALQIPINKTLAFDGGLRKPWFVDSKFETYIGLSYGKKDDFWTLGFSGMERKNPRLSFSYVSAM